MFALATATLSTVWKVSISVRRGILVPVLLDEARQPADGGLGEVLQLRVALADGRHDVVDLPAVLPDVVGGDAADPQVQQPRTSSSVMALTKSFLNGFMPSKTCLFTASSVVAFSMFL